MQSMRLLPFVEVVLFQLLLVGSFTKQPSFLIERMLNNCETFFVPFDLAFLVSHRPSDTCIELLPQHDPVQQCSHNINIFSSGGVPCVDEWQIVH